MKGTKLHFKNRPNNDATLSSFYVSDCLIAQNGAPTSPRPQVIIHLPKTNDDDVRGAWVDWRGSTYHVIGQTVPSMAENTPTRWNRYVIAEKVY